MQIGESRRFVAAIRITLAVALCVTSLVVASLVGGAYGTGAGRAATFEEGFAD
ncbi:hypothetical protein [Methylobacterium sp. A54F]